MERIFSRLRKLPEHYVMLSKVLALLAAINFYISIILHDIDFKVDAFLASIIGALLLVVLAGPILYRWAIKPYQSYLVKKHSKELNALREQQYTLEKANNDLRDQTFTDPLTRLANRRSYEHRYHLEFMAANRSQLPLSLMMIDIDHFKQFNDNYGHQEGDNALVEISSSLKNTFVRSTDMIARFGGEEFVAILPNTDEYGAIAFANRIRENVENLQIPHQFSMNSNHVTISIGTATMQNPLCTKIGKVQLLKAADDSLYEAKQTGRNRVVSKSIP